MVLALLLAIASPDPGLARLSGSWSCTTGASSDVLIDSRVDESGVLQMKAHWRNVDDNNIRAAQHGAWTQSIAPQTGGGYAIENDLPKGIRFTGASVGFSGDTFEAKGSQGTPDRNWVAAERYTLKNGDREFIHEWFALSGDQWTLTSKAVCRKI